MAPLGITGRLPLGTSHSGRRFVAALLTLMSDLFIAAGVLMFALASASMLRAASPLSYACPGVACNPPAADGTCDKPCPAPQVCQPSSGSGCCCG